MTLTDATDIQKQQQSIRINAGSKNIQLICYKSPYELKQAEPLRAAPSGNVSSWLLQRLLFYFK